MADVKSANYILRKLTAPARIRNKMTFVSLKDSPVPTIQGIDQQAGRPVSLRLAGRLALLLSTLSLSPSVCLREEVVSLLPCRCLRFLAHVWLEE